MKENKLTIQVNRPVEEVFAFTTDPKNTPSWIEHIVTEETNEWPIRLGSIYRNRAKNGQWSEYTVTALEENRLFELTSKNGNYHVRYTYKPIDSNATEMEYYEWVDEGELDAPFSAEVLEKLKEVLEND